MWFSWRPPGERGQGVGWPDVAGDTALTIKVPEADPLVRAGFPAHVTVLYPFLHESRIDGPVHHELRALFRSHDAFDLTFAEFARYPGVLYLAPRPAGPIRALTRELTGRWPEAVPYRGLFGEGLDPHLTVANHEGPETWERTYDALETECASALPVTSRIAAVHLIVRDGDRWRDRTAYPLGGVGEVGEAGEVGEQGGGGVRAGVTPGCPPGPRTG
ncbi:hypothetical protein BGM19_20830 [Streptomyces agglomeratus]|nr:hypothetical protein BGM19_20830 [Streptomyces agglomeratus]